MNDLEAARYITEALANLSFDYPNRDEVHRAYGQLILGKLGLKPMEGYMFHYSFSDFTRLLEVT